MENLEPKREERSPISSLKFQRKSDYKKFRNFIKKETKELKGISEPKDDKVKNILKVGAGGLGLFTIGGMLAAIKGRDGDDTSGKFKAPFIIGRRNPSDLPDLPKAVLPINRSFIEKPESVLKSPSVKKTVTIKDITTSESFQRKKQRILESKKQTVSVGGETVEPSGSGVDSGRGSTKPKKQFQSITPLDKAKNYAKRTGKSLISKGKVIEGGGGNFFLDLGKGKIKLDVATFSGKDYYFLDIERVLFDDRFTVDEKTGKIKFNPSATIRKPNIFKRFMNFYNQGRTPAEDTMKFFGKDGLIADDFSKITRTDKAFKDGAKGLKGARPFKAFTPNMLKTGPTPLTRQLIERPFRSLYRAGSSGAKFLKNNSIVNSLLKSKVTKTGFFVIDLLFAGQAFADLFKPKDNIRTSVVDLYNAINNQIYKDDPSKLKYYISESSDERIRAYQIKQNQKIRLLKEQANVDLGGPQNILIVPETKQNNEVKPTIPIKKGGDKVSFVPFEPVNSVGTDILLHKLNQ